MQANEHSSVDKVAKNPVMYPWCDCKVAFAADVWDDDHIWDYFREHGPPDGWRLTETDSAGSRTVAVFRVPAGPTQAAGEQVKTMLNRLKRWSDKKHREEQDQLL